MKNRITRRRFIGAALTGVAAAGTATASNNPGHAVTPPHTEGPFYPIHEQSDRDADLTRLQGHSSQAAGEVVIVLGQVRDTDGQPIAGALVDVWQANTHGRYAHERDPNPAPLDEAFQGWAILTADDAGWFRFKTIVPGAYPVSDSWTRPPHIHFKVSRRGFREITTQMYFEGQSLNDVDRLLNDLPSEQQKTLIAQRSSISDDPDTDQLYRFDVVLAAV